MIYFFPSTIHCDFMISARQFQSIPLIVLKKRGRCPFYFQRCFLMYLTFSTNFDFLHILMTFCTLRFIFWILSIFVFIFPSSTHSQEVFAYHGDLHKNAGWKYFSLCTHIFLYLYIIKFRPKKVNLYRTVFYFHVKYSNFAQTCWMIDFI